MSIVIKLYSFNKKENSTLAPESTDGTSFDCLIKTPSSMLTPIVELHSLTNPSLYNYAYIPDFYRYYYITDWTFDRGLWYASLRVDVLATYRVSIGAQPMYVLRASRDKDEYVMDNMYPLTGRVSYDSTIFELSSGTGYKDGYFVITTVGEGNNAGQTIWQMDATKFNVVMNKLLANAGGSNTSWSNIPQGIINSILNPTDYIVSAFWFPKEFAVVLDDHFQPITEEFKCGLWPSGEQVEIVSNVQVATTYQVNIPKHPQASTIGKYLNMKPYTHYELDLGFIGTIDLDTSKLVDIDKLLVTINADPMTGVARVEGRTLTNDNQMQLFNVTANYGVPINIAMGKNNVFNALTGIAQASYDVATSRPKKAMVDAVSAVGDVADALAGTVTNTGSIGSLVGHLAPKRLFSRFYEVVENDNDHLGSPLCKVKRPMDFYGGYILAKDCDIAISWATQPEIDEIKRYATTGFFYEL